MAKLNAPLFAFNRGEIGKLALGRIDVEKLRLSAECQLNWLPYVLGPMMLRPGLEYIGETLGDAATKLVPFVFSKLDTALLVLTPNSMQIYIDDELVTRSVVSTVVTNGTFPSSSGWDLTTGTTSGASAVITPGELQLACRPLGGLAQARQALTIASQDQVTEHGLRIVVAYGPVTVRVGSTQGADDLVSSTAIDTGTHSLAFMPNGGSAYVQIETAGAPLRIVSSVTIDNPASGSAQALTLPTPWGAADLPNIRYDASGDIIFVGWYGQQQRKIERRALHGWSVATYYSQDGPYQNAPAVTANFAFSDYAGVVTVASDVPFFQPGHIGAVFRVFSPGQNYLTVLGAQNTYTPAIEVTGVGTARDFNCIVQGSWSGTITLQVSFTGPTSGFVDIGGTGSNETIPVTTGGATSTPDLDNVTAWYRAGFKAGDYSGGTATVSFDYTGGGGYGVFRINGYFGPKSVGAEVLVPLASTTATTDWVESQWSTATTGVGWPSSVCFHEGRLWWFGQDWFYGSESNAYYEFSNQDSLGNSLGDSGAIIGEFGSGPADTVSWGLSLLSLLMGREETIARARSDGFDEPMTPTNISVKDVSTNGAARLPAIKIDQRGVFVQQSGARVYELVYNPQRFDYAASDLTRLNLDIGVPGFVAIAAQRQPDNLIHLVRGDGLVAVLLDDADDDVVAWWRLMTLGLVLDVARLPGSGLEDSIYYTVQRTVNGGTRTFIEKAAPRANCVGGLINQLFDCHVVYQGAATNSITLAQLPNTEVGVWADGAYIGTGTTNSSGVLSPLPDGNDHSNIVAGLSGSVQTYSGSPTSTFTGLAAFNGLPCEVFADQQPSSRLVHLGTFTVEGGAIALPNGITSATIVAMFGFVAPFQSAKLAYAAQGGSPLTMKKKIDHVGLVLFDTHAQGISYGQRFDQLDDLPLVEEGADVDEAAIWSQYDEPLIELPGEWDTDARLCLLAQAPFPCKVGGAVVGQKTNG